MSMTLTSPSSRRFDFGTLASRYDFWYETNKGRRHDAAQKQMVLSMLPATAMEGKRLLLDVGCGTGHWSVFFAEQGFEVTGVDVSPEMISTAQARNTTFPCRFSVADTMNLPFPDGQFDVVSAMAVLAFVSDARRACAEMIRCLTSGGCLVVGALNQLAELNRRRVAGRSEPYVSAQMFTPETLRALLTPFGSVTVKMTTEGAPHLPDAFSSKQHPPDSGHESGALIVAVAVKP